MMVEALVEHDYVAKESNELTITKGDVVKDVIKKQGGWLEGTLKDKKGLFPDNFVRVMDKETVVLRNRKDATRIRQCRVVYSYKQDHEDELNLNVGDVIDILGEEEEGWWRGVLNGKQGVFPSNFVEEIVSHKSKISNSRENLTELPDATPFVHSKPTKILCEVKFAYKAQNEDELTLKEGDIVTVLSKDGQDPGWWKGELCGVIGVFPDNFVTLLADDKSTKDDNIRKAKSAADPVGIKPSQITSQRRSLEVARDDREPDSKTTPPVPGKKPVIPIKKSPSGSGSSLFYGLKKKIVDAVDGATGSKQPATGKTEMSSNENLTSENAFDDVVRRPLLSDIRASRPKAPGRRLPSVIFKDMEPGVPNGNSEYVQETASSSSPEIDATDSKPKLREWEKHKAPWLEEMKLNQAKRTSTSPGPPEHKLKLPTPTDKATETQPVASVAPPAEETTPKKPPATVQNHETETPEIQSRPLSALGGRLKTPPNELEKTPMLRNKSNVPTPTRPQTIHNVNTSNLNEVAPHNLPKPSPPFHPKISPISVTNRTPSPLQKAHTVDKSNERITTDFTTTTSTTTTDGGNKQNYADLLERIAKLEELVEKQNKIHAVALEDLRNKLQLETEMRMKLQAEVEELVKDNGAIEQL